MAERTQRRTHKKVRTGCLTCKIRRKKCGEEKPACLRCTSTGRKCDGYSAGTTEKLGILTEDGKSLVVPAISTLQSKGSDTSNPSLILNKASRRIMSLEDKTLRQRRLLDPAPIHKPRTRKRKTPPHTALQQSLGCNKSGSRAPSEGRTKAGRNCSLYGSAVKNIAHMTLLRTPNALSELPRISDVEKHCLSYFRCRTVPRFALYFERSIWHDVLIRCALTVSHPVLFYTAVALGAVHRRYSSGISREAFQYCSQAARSYAKALHAVAVLKESVQRNLPLVNPGNVGPRDGDLVATSEMLLGVFQMFQAERSASQAHFCSAVQHLVSSPLRIVHSEAWHYRRPSKPRVVRKMVYQLYCRAIQLFGSPVELLGHESRMEKPSLRSMPPIPEVFSGLEEASNQIFAIMDNIWRTRPQGWESLEERRAFADIHETRLHEWTMRCAQVAADPKNTREAWQREALNLMHLTRSLAYLVIHGNILRTLRAKIALMPALPTFSIDNNPNDLGQVACAIAYAVERLRMAGPAENLSLIKSLMEEKLNRRDIFRFEPDSTRLFTDPALPTAKNGSSRIEEAVEMLGLFSMAKQISEIEENAIIKAIRHIIPPHADHIDIACVLLNTRHVYVRYHTPCPDGAGYAWVQEWWGF